MKQIIGILFLIATLFLITGCSGAGKEIVNSDDEINSENGLEVATEKDEMVSKSMDYIRSSLLMPDQKLEMISSEQEGDMYHLVLAIEGNEFDSYITIDGELFFPSAILISEELGTTLSIADATQKAVDYMNANLMKEGATAIIESTGETNGVYIMNLIIDGQTFESYVSYDGTILYPSGIKLSEVELTEQVIEEEFVEEETEVVEVTADGITTFQATGDDLCSEDGKPLIMLFSTTWCPHCKWITETFDSTVKSYGDDIAAYHWELDTGDNTLTEEAETEVPADLKAHYEKYNPQGSIPTYVMGCRYSRIGNGHESAKDLKAEEAEFKAVINELI